MKDNIFKKTRYKLTAYYMAIIFVIIFLFSTILIYTIESKLRENLDGKIIITEEVTDPIKDASYDINVMIYSIDSVLILIITILSYMLAGRTLKPIKNSLELQRKFSADASHDLRTPLAIITTESEVILQSKKPHKERDLLQVIESNLEEAKKMSKLVNDLILISRGEHEISDNFVPVDLAEFIEKIVHKLKFKIDSEKIEMIFVGGKSIFAKIDVINFERAISNVLQNAINYTEKGFIKITLGEDAKHVLIDISDSGVGIDKKDLPHVFDRFYKAKHSRNDSSGSGLGLPIAKQIIEQHKGSISISSVVGTGTSVRIGISKKL